MNDTVKIKQAFSVAFLSLNAGTGIPEGNFQTQGYAQPGFSTSFLAAATVDDSVIGFGAKINYGVNGIDQAAYGAYSNSTILSVGSYSYGSILGGLYIAGRSCRKFGFNIRLLLGYMFAFTPSVSMRTYDPTSNTAYFQGLYSSSTGGFCYNSGIGFSYLIGSHTTLFLDADYLYSSPRFFIQEWARSINGSSLGPVNNSIVGAIAQPFSIVTITVGIGFKIPGLHFYN